MGANNSSSSSFSSPFSSMDNSSSSISIPSNSHANSHADDPWYETTFLVASNILFLLPAILAFRRKYTHEGVMYTFTMITSMIYHYVSSVESGCLFGHHLCFSTMIFLDFYCAYSIITVTVALCCHDFADDKYSYVKQLFLLIENFIILYLTFEKIQFEYIIAVVCGCCVVHLIFAICIYKSKLLKLNWTLFSIGVIITLIGIVFFFLSYMFYWIFHSFWHMLIAIGIAFFIESRNMSIPCSMKNKFCLQTIVIA